MINASEDEALITFNVAAKHLPTGSRPSDATWWRWWRKGIKGVRLRTAVVGGRRFTTAAWLAQFISAVTAAANGEPMPSRTPAQRQRAISAAERDLGD